MNRTTFLSTLRIGLVCFVFAVTIGLGQSTGDDPAKAFYRMTKTATAAFNAAEYDKARTIAVSLIEEAERWKDNWNYGNAIHAANLVLGRIALARGEIDDAKKFLLAAGRVPGSPQLKSFGPDMVFAREMLKRGETETVLAYFDLVEKFWEKRSAKLDEWRAAIAKGDEPDFGANLRYFF